MQGQVGDGCEDSEFSYDGCCFPPGDEKTLPYWIPGLTNIISVTAAREHSTALDSAGLAWRWGERIESSGGISSPELVPNLTDIIATASGDWHSLALKSDGSLWAWGYNGDGQLGDGTETTRSTPVQVVGLENGVAIGAGSYASYAVTADGTTWAWGWNEGYSGGLLGVDSLEDEITSPMPVEGIRDVAKICGGEWHTLALKTDETVWSWGGNYWGQVGNGTVDEAQDQLVTRPTRVLNLDNIVDIQCGGSWSLALDAQGSVWGWGSNAVGQLGPNAPNPCPVPTRIPNLENIIAIATGCGHVLALKSDGTVWTWGSNSDGQLGDGTTVSRPVPAQVEGLTDVRAVEAGCWHSIALR
jgi:alpha-tubulin suppressor-like RCC1 family protein